jgi:hypothetical protein
MVDILRLFNAGTLAGPACRSHHVEGTGAHHHRPAFDSALRTDRSVAVCISRLAVPMSGGKHVLSRGEPCNVILDFFTRNKYFLYRSPKEVDMYKTKDGRR